MTERGFQHSHTGAPLNLKRATALGTGPGRSILGASNVPGGPGVARGPPQRYRSQPQHGVQPRLGGFGGQQMPVGYAHMPVKGTGGFADNPRFDSSEFPALGDAPAGKHPNGAGFAMHNEEFPALGAGNGGGASSIVTGPGMGGGAPPPPVRGQSLPTELNGVAHGHPHGNRGRGGAGAVTRGPLQGQSTPQGFGQTGNTAMLGGGGVGMSGQFPQHSTRPGLSQLGNLQSGVGTTTPVHRSNGRSDEKAVDTDKHGLKGLLGVIRGTHPDLNTLALGTDLTTLGLNLNQSESLYATFASPVAESPTRSKPDYVLPYCYYMQPPALKTSHLTKFQLETLFYIFYNMPQDTLQVFAAKELYSREWRYHKPSRLWFSRQKATEPGPAGDTYVYFDIQSWERKIYPQQGPNGQPTIGPQFAQDLMTADELSRLQQQPQ